MVSKFKPYAVFPVVPHFTPKFMQSKFPLAGQKVMPLKWETRPHRPTKVCLEKYQSFNGISDYVVRNSFCWPPKSLAPNRAPPIIPNVKGQYRWIKKLEWLRYIRFSWRRMWKWDLFWYMTWRKLREIWHNVSEEMCYFHLQGGNESTQKKQTVRSPEKLLGIHRTTPRHIIRGNDIQKIP